MKNIMKSKCKILVIICVVISLLGAVKVYYYLSTPTTRIDPNNDQSKYILHQYLTSEEVKERENIEKDFQKTAESVGDDVQKQKDITLDYQEKVKQFNKKIYERNVQRFKKYIDQIDQYFKEHPEAKENKKAQSQYIYLMSNVELNLFQQAAGNVKAISKELTLKILEE